MSFRFEGCMIVLIEAFSLLTIQKYMVKCASLSKDCFQPANQRVNAKG